MDRTKMYVKVSKGEHIGGSSTEDSKRVLQPHPITFRKYLSNKLHNEMLEEEKLREGTKSAKYEDVGEIPSFKEIMVRNT